MKRSRFSSIVITMIVVLGLLLGACQAAPATQATSKEPVKLVVLTHWGEESLATPMKALLDEYTKANPNVTIEYQAVTFDQLLTKISTSRAAGTAPDIIHIYNLWMPDFVKGGALATPPADVVADVKANYSPGSVSAVTVNDQIWGYPTEINTWQLVYNKKMFADAGLSEPPKTLDELKDYACKLTKKNPDGTLVHTGLAVLTGWDSGVVHPFLSLLWSNGGEYLASDQSKAMFNSPQSKEVLQAYSDMIKEGCVDPGLGGGFNDFVTGKSAMVIMANFFRSDLQKSFVDGYENVGVAPIPVGPSGDKSVALQYNWLWTVDKTSKNAEEAWKLVKWLNSPRGEGKASPMGEYLTSALGAIPSRLSDQKALSDTLSDFFLKAYLDSASTSQPEPVLVGGQEIKTALQTQIENTWYDKASIDEALQSAATEADRILSENK
ncbi:MAG TPA: extracellular solute-binding protein [Anaerolineales bacterium]|nr:extracellular solute-binding protein [Anaerolineales bacterium]